MQKIPLSPDQVFTVSELNSEVKWLLDTQFGSIWVEGELSNTMKARTGHMYFTLKDSRSQLRCAMFRNDNRRLDFTPADGQKVLMRGRLGIYEARGDYQMVVDRMLETGAGALQQQFEETKKRLHGEGLFDEKYKKSIPEFPTTIGLITSPTGAAVQDALNVLKRRFPCAQVIVYPATVQGKTAAPAIVKMIQLANQRAECDVLLMIRGGGSLEDLWAFNEEIVARAVFASQLPLVCGVGHEIDYTIADLTADLRAPTPSAAAELCTPDQTELQTHLLNLERRLSRRAMQSQRDQQSKLAQLQRRLANHHPSNRLRQRSQRCDELDIRLSRLMQNRLLRAGSAHSQLHKRLENLSPSHQLFQRRESVQKLENRLITSTATSVSNARLLLSGAQRALQAISPLNTLNRGYAIVQTSSGSVVTNNSQVEPGDNISVRVAAGQIGAKVTSLKPPQTTKTESS